MKIHNYLLTFVGMLVFLAFGHVVVLVKYFQALVHQGLYYCQEMVKALNVALPGAYGKILAIIFIFAAVFTLLKLLGSLYKVFAFRRTLLKKRTRYSGNIANIFRSLGLQEKVIIFAQAKPNAFCLGIRNPKIYLSTGLIRIMDPDELEIILRHEKYHLEHRDTLTLFLASIVESLFPFFPVVADLIKVYQTDREVAADSAAMTAVSDRHLLKKVLKKLIQYEPNNQPVFLPAIINTDTLEARIRSIHSFDSDYKNSDYKNSDYKNIGLRNVLISLISLATLLGLIVTPVDAIELHKDGQDVVMLCGNSVNCESMCRKRTIQLLQSKQSRYTPTGAVDFGTLN